MGLILRFLVSQTILVYLFIWGFTSLLNTVQVISQRVVGRAEETSTYSPSGFCSVNSRPTASNYTGGIDLGRSSIWDTFSL